MQHTRDRILRRPYGYPLWVNIVAVSKRLGHGSVDIPLRVYTHLLQKNNDEMLAIIEKSSQNLLDKNKKP